MLLDLLLLTFYFTSANTLHKFLQRPAFPSTSPFVTPSFASPHPITPSCMLHHTHTRTHAHTHTHSLSLTHTHTHTHLQMDVQGWSVNPIAPASALQWLRGATSPKCRQPQQRRRHFFAWQAQTAAQDAAATGADRRCGGASGPPVAHGRAHVPADAARDGTNPNHALDGAGGCGRRGACAIGTQQRCNGQQASVTVRRTSRDEGAVGARTARGSR